MKRALSHVCLPCLTAMALMLPGILWAECSVTVNDGEPNAVSAYSLSGQGNFNCGDLNMNPASATVTNPSSYGNNAIDWTLTGLEVDAVVVQDSSGKRCVYNYAPGVTGGAGLESPSTNKTIAQVFVCADGIAPPPPNNAPTVEILSPADGSTFAGGAEITFSATAVDNEDGDLSTQTTWNSNLDGSLGTDASLTTSDLSAGVHTITAQVADSGGLISADQISVTVEAMVVQQCEPADGGDVYINGTLVDCPDDTDEPRLVCSADLSADADKFELAKTGCCVCNTTAVECDPNLAFGDDPVNGLVPCPVIKEDASLQVPTMIMLNNDPYYCYTSGGQRRCYLY